MFYLLFFSLYLSVISFDDLLQKAKPLIALSTYAIGSHLTLYSLKKINEVERFNVKSKQIYARLDSLAKYQYRNLEQCKECGIAKIHERIVLEDQGHYLSMTILLSYALQQYDEATRLRYKLDYIEERLGVINKQLNALSKATAYLYAKYWRTLTVMQRYKKEIPNKIITVGLLGSSLMGCSMGYFVIISMKRLCH